MSKTVAEVIASGETRCVLVVQGGGMRGVYSMGALAALEDRGLNDAFYSVTGSSAGAINAAYLLAGQANKAVDVYVDELSNRQFVNPLRLTRIVDIDFMVDTALKQCCPLNLARLRASRSLLNIVLTDAETAQPVVFDGRDNQFDIYELIRATAALPGLYDKRVRINGREYVDGGVVDGVPLDFARESDADFALAVLTRSPGFRREAKGPVFSWLGRLLARRQSEAVKATIGRADDRFNRAMDALETDDALVRVVSPSDDDLLVGRTTSNKSKLIACAEMGRRDMLVVLDAATPAHDDKSHPGS